MSDPLFTRRSFIATSVGACLAASSSVMSGRQARADAAAARVSFGFSLYGMRSLKLADALKACAEIGYDAVELVTVAGWPSDPDALPSADRAALRRQLGDLGLQLPALMENLTLAADAATHRRNLDRLKASADLAHALSPDRPPVIETVLGGSPAKWNELKATMAAALGDWAKVAESTKTVLAIKPHVGGALHTPDGAKWLVETAGSPHVRLTYDFSHYRLRGIPLDDSLKALLPHTAFIHVKDAEGTAAGFTFLLPGAGDIDYPRYFALLNEGSYRGSVTVEVSGQIHTKPGYDPFAAAKTSYENLAPPLEKSGLRRPPRE